MVRRPPVMARRDTLLYASIGGVVLIGLATSKRRLGGVLGGTGPVLEGLPGGDVISYVTDPSGLILVSTPQKDVDFGVPKIAPSYMGLFRDMVSKWKTQIDDLGAEFRVPSSTAFGIMWSESAGNAGKTHRNDNGTLDAGLMQVNQVNWGGRSQADMMNPTTNLRVALGLLRSAIAGFRDLPQVASMYNAGANPATNGPYTNADRPKIATRWGFVSSPGYIDSVVAASNTYLQEFEKVA
jgi:hypothetical protein